MGKKTYRLKAEGGQDVAPRDTQQVREAAQEARKQRRAKRAKSRQAAIDQRLADSVAKSRQAAIDQHEKPEQEVTEHASKSVTTLSNHEHLAPNNQSLHGSLVSHNASRSAANTNSSNGTGSKAQSVTGKGKGQEDLQEDNADAPHDIGRPSTNASRSSEVVAKHAAHTVLGYVLQRGQRCGVCGDSNNIRLGQQGDAFDAATRATAIKVCGPVCDKHAECGGFNFVESLGNCYYRKVTSCQEVEDEDRDCYARASSAVGAAQEKTAEAAEVVAGQLHGLAQDLKGASAALGGVGSAPKPGSIAGHEMPALGFIKTPRTGGSEVTKMLMRLGEARNLSFFLPSGHGDLAKGTTEDENFGWPGPFPGPDAAALNGAPMHQFDMLCHGGVFGEREMRAYLKGPKPFFFTVLRRPALQMASSFKFFDHPAGDSWTERIKWLEKLWLSDGDASLGEKAGVLRSRFQNPQAHDLGWYQRVGGTPVFDQDDSAIAAWVEELEGSLDLVMLTEHLNEGLVLLGRKLGLGLEELAHAGRRAREGVEVPQLTEKDAAALEELVHVDAAAYGYFNRTFWESWEAAGGYRSSLSADLAELERRSAELDRACADEDEVLCPWSFMAETDKLTEHIKRHQLAADA